MPIFYECDRCTACCRWPGEVRLTSKAISRIADYLGLSEFEFIQEYTRLTEDRGALALTEKSNGECIFLKGRDCIVQAVKPRQCREFPNLWNFPDFQKVCRAIPHQVGEEEYERLVREAVGEA
jgi:Fe-S-cluster containining protein